MSDTPRTDHAANESISAVYELGRQLERELAEVRREMDKLIKKHRETKCEFCGMIPLTEKEHEWIRLHGHE